MGWRLRLVRLLPLALLVVAIVALPVMALSPTGWPWLQRLRDDGREARSERARLIQEIERLRVRGHRLKTDLAAVEAVARDKYGLIRENEVVFVFSESLH